MEGEWEAEVRVEHEDDLDLPGIDGFEEAFPVVLDVGVDAEDGRRLLFNDVLEQLLLRGVVNRKEERPLFVGEGVIIIICIVLYFI